MIPEDLLRQIAIFECTKPFVIINVGQFVIENNETVKVSAYFVGGIPVLCLIHVFSTHVPFKSW